MGTEALNKKIVRTETSATGCCKYSRIVDVGVQRWTDSHSTLLNNALPRVINCLPGTL